MSACNGEVKVRSYSSRFLDFPLKFRTVCEFFEKQRKIRKTHGDKVFEEFYRAHIFTNDASEKETASEATERLTTLVHTVACFSLPTLDKFSKFAVKQVFLDSFNSERLEEIGDGSRKVSRSILEGSPAL